MVHDEVTSMTGRQKKSRSGRASTRAAKESKSMSDDAFSFINCTTVEGYWQVNRGDGH